MTVRTYEKGEKNALVRRPRFEKGERSRSPLFDVR